VEVKPLFRWLLSVPAGVGFSGLRTTSCRSAGFEDDEDEDDDEEEAALPHEAVDDDEPVRRLRSSSFSPVVGWRMPH